MKTFYHILGFIALGLGVIGAFLPIMPTTCFILLAAWCFSKSSDRWHHWLLSHKLFGPALQQWQQSRCIPYKAKLIATISMLISGAYSLLILESVTLKIILITLITLGIYSIYSIKKCTIYSS